MKKLFSLLSVLCVAGLGVGLLAACDDEEEEHTHSYTSSVTTAATCTEDGVMTYTCSCGDTYTEVIKASGHTVGEWVVTLEPTCTEAGTQVKSCSVCGEVVETEDIEALGHDFSSVEYLVTTVVAEYLDDGEDNTGSTGGWYYVCSRCGEVGEALEENADPFAVGLVCASSEAGLKAALEAVGETREDEEVVITITSDMTIGENATSGSEFEIGASNVTICGAESVTVTLNQEITISGNNVTLTGLDLDGSNITCTRDTTSDGHAEKEHAIYVTGSTFTITDCTLISSAQAGILVESGTHEITVSNCYIDAPRAVYAIAPTGNTGTITLTISGSHLEGTYPFNLTRYNGTITVTDSELVGWTSYSSGTNATFKGCTFSFSDRGDYAYGMLRAYGPTVLDHCYFASYDGSGVSSTIYVDTDTQGHGDSANANNFCISTGNNAAIYTVIDCQFEDVTIVEDSDNIIEVKDITSETVVSLIETDVFQNTYTSSGFKFGDDTNVWTYSDLVPTNGGDASDD